MTELLIAILALIGMGVGTIMWHKHSTLALKVIIALGALVLFVTAATAQTVPYYHLPNRALTPGAIASTDATQICEKDYPARSRNVSNSLRSKIYKDHGVDKEKCRGDCKIDHLVPLAVGGSNDPKNLWPHEYGADFSVHEKTRLEVLMRKKVCNEGMPVQQAQACFLWNWTVCYEYYYPGQNAARREKISQ